MRFSAIALAMLAMPLAVFSKTDAENAARCAKVAGNDYAMAINTFCARQNIVVPSTYAANGIVHGKARARIGGSCGRPAWVPSYWCRVQFHSLCAAQADRVQTGAIAKYGDRGCQVFLLGQKDVHFG